MLWEDKGKIQALIGKQRINLADVTYLDLDSVAKVVKNFGKPVLVCRKNLEILRQVALAEDGIEGPKVVKVGDCYPTSSLWD